MGVNGVGKTTTIGKLAKLHTDVGRKVVLAAGDTFRAAAIEQLQIWGQRTGCTVVYGKQGADAAGLAYGALEQAKAEQVDLLLIDTAGRLHNKDNLMAELQKIQRVLGKLDDTAPHDRLLVLDATTGQNAHAQVEAFQGMCDVTGLVVQRISGQPFDEYLEEHIFAPLGMTDTSFAAPESKRNRFLGNHFWNGQEKKLVPVPSRPGVAMSDYHSVTLFSGGGGLVSSAMDYMKFAEAMRAGGTYNKARILSAKTVRYMTRNHLPASVDSGGSGENRLTQANQRGFGFGLGFGLSTDAVKGGVLGSAGTYS